MNPLPQLSTPESSAIDAVVPLSFATKEEALIWVEEEANDPCVDNLRFAFLDDEDAMAVYNAERETGCCGYLDEIVVVAGRAATVGCNYGH